MEAEEERRKNREEDVDKGQGESSRAGTEGAAALRAKGKGHVGGT